MSRKANLRLLLATSLLLVPVSLNAQTTVTKPADPGHAAGGLHRALFGTGYREAWVVPITVPVVNLDTFAGGLTAFREGGNQSRTLRFRAGNGKVYQFRSTRKFLPRAMPDDLQDTPAGDLIQDQSSAMHPTGHLVVSGLQQAAGVIHPVPKLWVLPDHPRLGEFRKDFAGLMGQIEERPQDYDDNEKLNFAGAEKIEDPDEMIEELENSMEDYMDEGDYLRARLIDFLVGDTDRGADQWQFARFDAKDGRDVYRPIPRDRDYAFMHSNGFLIRMVAMAYPKLVLFSEKFASLRSYMFMNREFDRSHLTQLTWADWDRVISGLEQKLTDAAIDNAVNSMPPEHRQLTGPHFVSSLRARRASLREYARKYYFWVNEEADIFASEERERAVIERSNDGSVTVSIFREGKGEAPAWQRRFVPDETHEIRLFMDKGDDRVLVRGTADNTIDVRVIGGEGDDVLVDSSRVSRNHTYTTFYDAHGRNTFVTGPHTRVSEKLYVARQPAMRLDPEDEKEVKEDRVALEERRGRFQDLMNTGKGFVESKTKAETTRNWGQTSGLVPALGLREGSGIIIGLGWGMTDYGFRRIPYETRFAITPMVSPTTGRLGAQLLWDRHPENSKWGYTLFASGSQFEANRLFGMGNNSPFDVDETLVRRDEVLVYPNLNYTFRRGSFISFGPLGRYSKSHLEALTTEGTTQYGGRMDVVLNNTDMSGMPRSGFTLRSSISGFAANDVFEEQYLTGTATAATYLSIGKPVLALRVGGSKVTGDNFAFQDAAFIGGQTTLRGYRWNRFAGEAAAFGGAELRIPIARAVIFSRGDLGIVGLADVGRVWFDGESEGGWHTGVGGGLFFHTLGQTVSVQYAKGEDEGRFYFKVGPAF